MSDVPNGLIVQEPPHFDPPPPPPAPPTWPPSWPGGWGAPPPTPPTPPTKRRPVRNVIAGIAVFVLFIFLGAAVGAQLSGSHTATSGATTTANGASATVAAVDPAVVDITTTLEGGHAAGTGMVISADGLVLTNNHVIQGATTIDVQIGGSGPTHSAHIVGYSVTDDLAVIRIDDVSGLQTVTTGDSSTVEIGDPVTAIGNALGRTGPHAVSTGKVTALNQPIRAEDASGLTEGERLTGLIEFSASLQPGDSGGVLINTAGEVIGVNTAASIANGSRRSSATAGFAIPINRALDVAHQIEDGKGSATIHIGERGILGVEIAEGSTANGVTVGGFAANSPAARAGIAEGDVIRAVDGHDVRSRSDLQAALNPHQPGDTVDVRWVDRSGQTRNASVTLMIGPPA